MALILFEGQFDNGHDFYNSTATVDVDINKAVLTDDEIVTVADELISSDRHSHGKSYRGGLIGFQVADSEIDNQESIGNYIYNEDTADTYPENGIDWIHGFSCDEKDIDKAYDNERAAK